jgi:hypothetical protein
VLGTTVLGTTVLGTTVLGTTALGTTALGTTGLGDAAPESTLAPECALAAAGQPASSSASGPGTACMRAPPPLAQRYPERRNQSYQLVSLIVISV